MLETIGLVLLGVLCWRRVFRMFVEFTPDPDHEDIAFSFFLACCCFPVGPFFYAYDALMLVTGGADPARFARIVAGESRSVKRARRERELRDREQRIRDAERELGL